ncbi:hypothetical protein G6M70_08645 [Agrobacterium tumefaciens]|uniref:Uncharacterized protein n=1 Tax=Agrobacterium tumefaciens TaxID=358 RepID=A0A2L2LGX3_AGRTU|nr:MULTISPECIES: hypothetical protein [Rhizobium/Agrobacterium group]MCZ7493797.1 hypothetical protein [Rhizobium rhizogenes]AVH43585.1 hypothetical protein At1D1609_35320 [Agrobacterium tumefaciens]MBW9072113.1 hypothetical protein [Agrobacterium deltaense]MCZ7501467.1 hypothetical protein [Rhizobium rhizogenes]NSY97530.1 hypothetical protein [Agrobacterium tumefaciens]
MAFEPRIEPYQRADDVGYAVSEFMWFKGRPFYPVSALVHAKVAHARLSAEKGDEEDEDNLDILFRMPLVAGGHFFEIVLRSNEGTSYGGWVWGEELEILNEFVNGYRVLAGKFDDRLIRFEYSRRFQRYRTIEPLPVEKSVFLIQREAKPYAGRRGLPGVPVA